MVSVAGMNILNYPVCLLTVFLGAVLLYFYIFSFTFQTTVSSFGVLRYFTALFCYTHIFTITYSITEL